MCISRLIEDALTVLCPTSSFAILLILEALFAINLEKGRCFVNLNLLFNWIFHALICLAGHSNDGMMFVDELTGFRRSRVSC